MEALVIILVLLISLAVIVGVVSLLTLLIMAISKKNVKKVGIVTGSAFGVAVLSFIALIIVGFSLPTETNTADKELPDSSADANNQTVERPAAKSKSDSDEDEDFDDEYDKKLEEIRAEREEEENSKETYGYQHEVIDGVDVYSSFEDTYWDEDSYMYGFSMDMTELLTKIHDDLENGVVFRSGATLTDTYGNEEKKYVLNVWYSQDTVEKINYDNWPTFNSEDLYDTADGFVIHPALSKNTEIQNKELPDNAPEFVAGSLGQMYKE